MSVESLEQREMLASITMTTSGPSTGKTLDIQGTNAADHVTINDVAGGQIEVKYRSGTGTEKAKTFSGIAKIQFNGKKGNDHFVSNPYIPVVGRGGDGNDYLAAGNASDQLFGDAGNDALRGFGGANELRGGSGNDDIEGGDGDETFIGGSGMDVLDGVSGKDYFDGGAGWDRYRASFAPFVDGPSITDIRQAESGVCTILASLGSTIGYVNWEERVRIVDGQHYEVQLYNSSNNAFWQQVDFDGTWSDDDASPSVSSDGRTYEAWVVVMQRGVLTHYGVPWDTQFADNWDKYGGDWQHGTRALPVFVGGTASYLKASSATASTIANLLNVDYLVAEAKQTGGKTSVPGSNIVGAHAYAVLGATYEASGWVINLYNPWGQDGFNNKTKKNVAITGANDGFFSVSVAAFKAYFDGIAYV